MISSRVENRYSKHNTNYSRVPISLHSNLIPSSPLLLLLLLLFCTHSEEVCGGGRKRRKWIKFVCVLSMETTPNNGMEER
jgi:hypothetical protein